MMRNSTMILKGGVLTLACAATAAVAQVETPGSVPDVDNGLPVAQQQLDSVAIPREIAPAMMPYLICRQSEQGVALYDSEGNVLNREDPTESCASVREKSKNHTVRMLGDLNLGRHRGERVQYAERWLAKIDELAGPDMSALQDQAT